MIKKILFITLYLLFILVATGLKSYANTNNQVEQTINKIENNNVEPVEPSNIYLSLGFGYITPSIDHNLPDVFKEFLPDENGIIFNFLIGYNINKYLALESETIFNFGSTTTQEYPVIIDSMFTTTATETSDSGSISTYINLVAKYPIKEKHIPFFKIGLGYSSYQRNIELARNFNGNLFYTEELEISGLSIKPTIGYEFALTKNHSFIFTYGIEMHTAKDLDYTYEEYHNIDKFTFKINKLTANVFDFQYKYTLNHRQPSN